MKLVIITSRFPFPIEKGDKLRIYHQIRELAQYHDIYLFSLTDCAVQEEFVAHLREFCKQIHIFRLSKLKILFSLIASIWSKLPFQVAYFYNKNIANQIFDKIQELNPDFIYCQLIRTALYAKRLPQLKTIDYMDTFSVGMQRRAKNTSWLWRWIFDIEAKRLAKFEANIYHDFDHHVIISEQDRALLTFPEKQHIEIIPNGVDTHYFDPSKYKNKPTYDLLFVGNMGYYPNVTAAQYIVKEVLPLLPNQTTLLISGARPSTEVSSLANERVSVSGWIDDIRDAYSNASIFLAPILFGSGQQNKILEAMAMSIPCITTSLVNNAIGAKPNKEILIADTPQQFVHHILAIKNNEINAQTIAAQARNFVIKNYSWQNAVNSLNNILIGNNQNGRNKI